MPTLPRVCPESTAYQVCCSRNSPRLCCLQEEVRGGSVPPRGFPPKASQPQSRVLSLTPNVVHHGLSLPLARPVPSARNIHLEHHLHPAISQLTNHPWLPPANRVKFKLTLEFKDSRIQRFKNFHEATYISGPSLFPSLPHP